MIRIEIVTDDCIAAGDGQVYIERVTLDNFQNNLVSVIEGIQLFYGHMGIQEIHFYVEDNTNV